MELLVLAGVGWFGVIGSGLMLKGAGGWFQINRARHRRGDPAQRTWESLGTSFKGWYFILPALAVCSVLATIGGVILLLR